MYRFITKKVCTSCSRTSYKIVNLTNLNKYLHYDTRETEVNINININKGTENFTEKKNTATSGKLIIAAYGFVVHLYISCTCVRSARE